MIEENLKLQKLTSALLIKVERADTSFGRYFVVYLRKNNKKYTFFIKRDYKSHNEFLLKEHLNLFDFVEVDYYDYENSPGVPIFNTKEKIFQIKSIKKSEEKVDEKIKVAAFDLETDVDEEHDGFEFNINNQIFCISYCTSDGISKVLYWAPQKLEEEYNNKHFEYYSTERELILGFLRLLKETAPDILVAHNGYNFDIIFLWARAMYLDIPLLFGPSNKGLYWREAYPQEKTTSDERIQRILKQIVDEKTNQIKSTLIEYEYKKSNISYEDLAYIFKYFIDRENIVYNIKGCYLIDTLLIAHRELYHLLETFEIQNFKLDTLSKYFFKDRKKDVEGNKIGSYWRAGKEKLRDLLLYNLQDSRLNLKLAQLPLFVPYLCALSQKICDTPESILFYNVRANTSLYKSIIRNMALQNNTEIPVDPLEKEDYFNKAIESQEFKKKLEEIKAIRKKYEKEQLKFMQPRGFEPR